MTGQAFFAYTLSTPGVIDGVISFSKDGNNWWVSTNNPDTVFFALQAAAADGRFWNANLWKKHTATGTSWTGFSTGILTCTRLTGVGAYPYPFDFSFTF